MNSRQTRREISRALKEDDVEKLRAIAVRDDINFRCYDVDSNKDSVIHVACRLGNLSTLRFLHKEIGVSLELNNADGKRPLHEAAQSSHLDLVQYLVKEGADVNSLKRADWTPLMLACTKTNLEIIKYLLEHGADPKIRNKDGWSCFHVACRQGDADTVRYLLSVAPELERTTSNNGRTPLHTAALHGQVGVVRELVMRNPRAVDHRDNCGTTALMDAARSNSLGCFECLLKAGADVTARDLMARNCLHLAAQTGAETMVTHILDMGLLPVNSESASMMTPTDLAVRERQETVVGLLVRAGGRCHVEVTVVGSFNPS